MSSVFSILCSVDKVTTLELSCSRGCLRIADWDTEREFQPHHMPRSLFWLSDIRRDFVLVGAINFVV